MEAIQIMTQPAQELKPLRDYQSRIVASLIENLDAGKKCVLGMCTGGGKTFVAYNLISRYLSKDPSFRVLVLAHNQTVLRRNFQDENALDSFELTSKRDLTSEAYRSTSMVITIPSTIHHVSKERLGKFDLIIVDEAHEFFHAKMTQSIIKLYPKAKLLALTATHGKFPASEWHKELFSVMEGFDAGVLSNPNIEVVATNWDYTDEDFTSTDELGKGYQFSDSHFLSACEAIDSRLKSVTGKNSSLYNRVKALPSLKREYPKTMVATYNKDMADYIFEYFKSQMGDSVVVSYSDGEGSNYSDSDSASLERFKQDPECRMLIVVRRGILGFDCPELEYMIDLTASKNVERTLQLCGRIMRKPDKDVSKIYLKIVPEHMVYYTCHQMGAVVALFHKENDRIWSGKWKEVPIICKEHKRGTKAYEKRKSNDKVKALEIPNVIIDFSAYRDIFEQLTAKGNTSLQGVMFTNLKKIREQRRLKWDFEACRTDALRFDLRFKWARTSPGAYHAAWANGWLEECCKHMSFSPSLATKRVLLKMARAGETKPKKGTKLYGRLASYVAQAANSYDEAFRTELLSIRPDWFPKAGRPKAVVCVSTNQIFQCISEAGKVLNVDKSSVGHQLRGNLKVVSGYVFRCATPEELAFLGYRKYADLSEMHLTQSEKDTYNKHSDKIRSVNETQFKLG